MDKITDFNNLLKFADFLNRFRTIERTILVNGSDRMENDSEHSFNMAMLGWYINTTYKLSLDTEKLLKYALVHDLVEIYAGDTYIYSTDQKFVDSKKEREDEALFKIKENFVEFAELASLIEIYNKKNDRESKFIYALDKIEPILNIYLDKGETWKKLDITLDMLVENKTNKVSIDPTIKDIFDQLLLRLQAENDELFGGLKK